LISMKMDKQTEFSYLYQYVEAALEQDPRCRDDDMWLMFTVYRDMGYNIFIPYEKMGEMPRPESVSRCRRKFQEEGRFKPSQQVQEKRAEAEETMKDINQWW